MRQESVLLMENEYSGLDAENQKYKVGCLQLLLAGRPLYIKVGVLGWFNHHSHSGFTGLLSGTSCQQFGSYQCGFTWLGFIFFVGSILPPLEEIICELEAAFQQYTEIHSSISLF